MDNPEKAEVAMKNGQSRDRGNIFRKTQNKKQKNKKTQHNKLLKKMSNTDLDFVLKVDGLVDYCLMSNEWYFLSVFRMRSSCTFYIFLYIVFSILFGERQKI